jgi:hypothetical protein
MAIAKRPNRTGAHGSATHADEKAEAFIAGAGKPVADETSEVKKTVILRIEPELIQRFDGVAKRLGISRAAFIVSSAVKELERMESS